MSGSDPDARTKKRRKEAGRRGSGISNPPSLADTKREMPNERRGDELPNERRRGNCRMKGVVGVVGVVGENCRKYATEMNNEQDNRQLLLIFMLFICICAKKVVPLQPQRF